MNDDTSCGVELPKYVSHKTVWALKIKKVNKFGDGGAAIHPAENGYGAFGVTKEYMEKHNPVAGGYYVLYTDGYKSFSPAKAFEEGYSKV